MLLCHEKPRKLVLINLISEHASHLPVVQHLPHQVHVLLFEVKPRTYVKVGRSTLPDLLWVSTSRIRQYRRSSPSGCQLTGIPLLIHLSDRRHAEVLEELAHKELRRQFGNVQFAGAYKPNTSKHGESRELYEHRHLDKIVALVQDLSKLSFAQLKEKHDEYSRKKGKSFS